MILPLPLENRDIFWNTNLDSTMFYERNSRVDSGLFFPRVKHTIENIAFTGKQDHLAGSAEHDISLSSTVVEAITEESTKKQSALVPRQAPPPSEMPAARSRKDNATRPSANSSPPPDAARTPTLNSETLSRPLNVLVADDNLLIRTSLLNLLEKWGMNAELCENGLKAQEKLHTQSFDLILIDLQMPYIDGHEVVTQLRSDYNHPNQGVPIIAMAGSIDDRAREQMLSAGATDYLNKPLDPKLLYKLISERAMVPEHRQVSMYTDVIDYTALQEMYRNDHAHLEMMLDIFLRNTPSALQAMDNALAKEDWDSLERQVHKIRPTFAMVGLQRIGDAAAELETILNEQKERLYHNIYTDFNRFRIAIKQSLKVVAEQRESIQDYLK